MRRVHVWLLLGLTPTLALGGTGAPLQWSPDGRWVAYSVSVASEPPILPAGWLFETGTPGVPRPRSDAPTPSRIDRIYAVELETGASVILEESRAPLTSPAWSPDGRAMAYGRLVDAGPGPARFELLIQDAPRESRVLYSRNLGENDLARPDLTDMAPAWSPDGRYLAVPDLKAVPGLSVIRR